jgi:hypothetical protein
MHELGDRTTRGAPRARARAERGRAHLRAGVRRTRRGRWRRASTRRRGRWRERRRRFRRGPRGRPGPQLSQRPSRRRRSPSRSATAARRGGDWRGSWPRGVGRAGNGELVLDRAVSIQPNTVHCSIFLENIIYCTILNL